MDENNEMQQSEDMATFQNLVLEIAELPEEKLNKLALIVHGFIAGATMGRQVEMVLLYIFTAALLGYAAGMITTKKRAMKLMKDLKQRMNDKFGNNTKNYPTIKFGVEMVEGWLKEFL